MSEKGSANVKTRDTESHPPTNSSTYGYGGNKEFDQWWEHWMSKVPSGRSTLTKPDRARRASQLEEPMKDAA